MNLTRYFNKIITDSLANIDKSQQLQTEILPEINFKYNSINLLISRRGVGKTFAILRECFQTVQVTLVLHDLIDAKSAYQDPINNELQKTVGEDVKKDLFETLDLKDWTEETPHTAILLDDAINILKDNKFKLTDLLFQNRQPRLTIFICAQDMFGVPVQFRRNCYTVWIFAGMTDKLVFRMIMNQFGLNFKDWWETYSELKFRDVLIITL
jgi:hypothetical protein